MKFVSLFLIVMLFIIQAPGTGLGKSSQQNKSCEALAQEYRILLDEKRGFETNKSYQKRKIKRKYKHRPYIKELIEKEKKLDAQLEAIKIRLDLCGDSYSP